MLHSSKPVGYRGSKKGKGAATEPLRLPADLPLLADDLPDLSRREERSLHGLRSHFDTGSIAVDGKRIYLRRQSAGVSFIAGKEIVVGGDQQQVATVRQVRAPGDALDLLGNHVSQGNPVDRVCGVQQIQEEMLGDALDSRS